MARKSGYQGSLGRKRTELYVQPKGFRITKKQINSVVNTLAQLKVAENKLLKLEKLAKSQPVSKADFIESRKKFLELLNQTIKKVHDPLYFSSELRAKLPKALANLLGKREKYEQQIGIERMQRNKKRT